MAQVKHVYLVQQQQLKCSTAEHRGGGNTGKGIKRKLHPFHPHAIPYYFHLSDEHIKSFRKKNHVYWI